MNREAETLSARWRSITLPRKMTEALTPFGTVEGRVDWRGITVKAYEAIEIDATGVDLTGATFEGATISLKLAESLLEGVTFSDCELTAARFDACFISGVTFCNCSLNHSKLSNCSVSDLMFDRGTADSVSFKECRIDRFAVARGSAEKMRFESSNVFLVFATLGQGNLTFSDCEGLVIFGLKAIPHRLFNRSTQMRYYLSSDASAFVKAARTGNWHVSDVTADCAGLTRLEVESGSIVRLRDLIEGGRGQG